MAKLVLDMSAMEENFFEESAMMGIGTALPAYNLCWMLNKTFDINFIRDTEQNISITKKGVRYDFPVYVYNFPNSPYKYLLYKLRNASEFLLPETKQLDFLWLIQTATPEEDALEILTELKSINEVQLAQLLASEQLKNLKNLIV